MPTSQKQTDTTGFIGSSTLLTGGAHSCVPTHLLETAFREIGSSSKRVNTVIELANGLRRFDPIQIRLVGSTALALLSANPIRNLFALSATKSDIDLHIISNDYSNWLNAYEFICFPKPLLSDPCFDILSTKIDYQGFTVSIHIYNEEVFQRLTRLQKDSFRMYRTTPKDMTFVYQGLHETIQSQWRSRESINGHTLDIIQHPIIDGHFYVNPYHHMALTGIDLLQSDYSRGIILRLLHHVLHHVTSHESCDRPEDFVRLFRYSRRPVPTILRHALGDAFVQFLVKEACEDEAFG